MINNTEYVLIKLNKDWADEFSVEAFAAMPRFEWQDILSSVEDHFKENSIEFNFGTNEGWELNSFSDWMNGIKISSISQEEYNTLLKLFHIPFRVGIAGYGTGLGYIIDITEFCDEDEEYEDEFGRTDEEDLNSDEN